jgi:hypothetical protein
MKQNINWIKINTVSKYDLNFRKINLVSDRTHEIVLDSQDSNAPLRLLDYLIPFSRRRKRLRYNLISRATKITWWTAM